MANLIIPDKTKHEFVVGIDFGHGETSAAICKLEWNEFAGLRQTNVNDIDIDRNARKKVIPSAICRANGSLYIGDEAFEHTTDNQGIRICFKQKPSSLDGEPELLMCAYMEVVYRRILEYSDKLKPGNHVVYIARPSGWTDEHAKEIYRQMALNAGIPLAGLTSESRAAIFYARNKDDFANEINRGAIVFDLGSSTLDLTYLSDNDSPIDYGYDLGASKIDGAIYDRLIMKSEDVREFIAKYPEYHDALLYKARKFKEEAYSRNENSKTSNGFTLESVISENDASYEEYGETYVKLRISNLHELNELVEEEVGYQANLRQALNDFKEKHIKGKKVNGVFLTGGASRMNFICPLIADVMGLPGDKVKIDGDNPSLTVSRGIALLGAADAITNHQLMPQLKDKLQSFLNNEELFKKLVSNLSKNLADAAWDQVKCTCDRWVRNGRGTDEDQLKARLEYDIKKFQQIKLRGVVEDTVREFIVSQGKEIQEEANEIVSMYAPGREISMNGNVGSVYMSSINESLEDMSKAIFDICDSTTNIRLAKILWHAFGPLGLVGFLAGYILKYPIKAVYNLFRDDSDIRKDKVKELLDKRKEVIPEVRKKLDTGLSSDRQFKASLMSALSDYFINLIDTSIQKAKIPIE